MKNITLREYYKIYKDLPPTMKEKKMSLNKESLTYIASIVSEHKSNLSEERDALNEILNDFEEKGGHKKALKTALALKDMETIKAQAYWRALEQYMQELGIFDQHDLFDPVEQKKLQTAE